ncbi:ADP-ribosylglycohydrolase family protein [Stackebrandtia nassauensis]|uniref:ADP-ribosylation/Crystallin J1 n=1 Tax=Stackebrandtia nassauensis (strain DSM 44728 / CIP 108903 / NRRL B-16338 / NBRC 102104 / LLR-40K-21) TaxID=446470 RepID=D3Q4I3_STANL|nr:ADP-ribosylglycohydrolase family protein [Stackebrandtia nassauensis]ADD40143.1 ADP-ribosylation/Crystallin J1 [Stackebrandtia nassauensis DSM 44728]
MESQRLSVDTATRDRRAAASLVGLSAGDAYGNQFFDLDAWRQIPCPGRLRQTPVYEPGHVESFLKAKLLPGGQWPWTDDSEMAFGIVAELRRNGEIDPDVLAATWASHYQLPRDYGLSALRILDGVSEGGDWRPLSRSAFDGAGSLGNGSAMRIAPLGAWFADDLDAVVTQARLASEITHSHVDGIAGGIATAMAAALSVRGSSDPGEFLEAILDVTPDGEVRHGIEEAAAHPAGTDPAEVAAHVGNGRYILATDTVPLCLWVAAHHLGDYPTAVRTVVSLGGDIDTNAAIVGGIVAAGDLREPVPGEWLAAREPYPHWFA